MKRYSWFFASTLLFVQCVSFAQQQFTYRRKLSTVATSGWHGITLSPDIFVNLNRSLSDIRLYTFINKDTVEIPYLLKIKTDDVQEQVVQLPIINKSKKDGLLYVTFQLKGGQQVNYLDLQFNQPNFFAFAKLEGSHDQKEWFEIANNERLLSIKNETTSYQVSTIHFATSDYTFLRLTIRSDTPLTISSAAFRDRQVKKGAYTPIPSQWTVQHDKKEKQTRVDIKLDHYRPVSNFRIEVDSQADYYRQFTVEYVTDSFRTEKEWIKNYQSFFNGYLTSYTTNAFNTTYDMAKELRVVIDNLDNTPLVIKSIEVSGPEVEIIAQLSGTETFLYYGNDDVGKPSYDLDYFQEKIPAAYPSANVGIEENLKQPPVTANALFENKIWLWSIMILVIGLLGFFTLRMMKVKPA